MKLIMVIVSIFVSIVIFGSWISLCLNDINNAINNLKVWNIE